MSRVNSPVGVKPWEANGDLATRGNDWMLDRPIETADHAEVASIAQKAWERQRVGLMERSPFLAKRMSDAGIDLSRLDLRNLHNAPFCSKTDLRDAQESHPPFGDHLAVSAEDIKLVYQTSGTSGKPCLLALTKRDMETWWSIGTRTYRAAGILPHNTVLVSFGAGPFVAGHTHGSIDRNGAGRVPVPPGDTERVVAAAEAGLFDTMLGTPSFALHLASTFASRGIEPRDLGITHVITGGEPGGGLPAVRTRIEEAFGCDVTEAMGLGDVSPSLFGECMAKGGMHFCGQGLVWPELIDLDKGSPIEIEAGAVGELVYTALEREAMPLVRFRSGDIVEIQGTTCECGRTGFRMRCVARVDDMIIVRGVNVYPSAVVGIVAEFKPHVTGRARLVVTGESVAIDPPVLVEVEVPSGNSPPEAVAEAIAKTIRERLIFRARVVFITDGDFGDAGYKTKLLIRK